MGRIRSTQMLPASDTTTSLQAAFGLSRRDIAQSPFDLVLTDLSVETPTAGYDLVHAAREQRRKPATLVISGFPDLLSSWEAEGADAGLQKPTDVPELLATINRLVADR